MSFRIAFILSILLFASCINKEDKYSFFLEKSYDNLQKGKINNAYAYADKAVAVNPNLNTGYILRGRSLFEMDSSKQAFNDFKKSLLLDSMNTTSLYYSGLILYDLSNYIEAIKFLNKAIKSKGSENLFFESNNNFSKYTFEENISMPDIRFFRGICYYYLNENYQAKNDLLYAMTNEFNLSKSCYYLGLIFLKENQGDIACKYFKLAMKKGNPDASGYFKKFCIQK